MNNLFGLSAKNCLLFLNLSEKDISDLLDSPQVITLNLNKGEYVFNQDETPEYLYVLISGTVAVGKNDINGKRSIVNVFKDKGVVFGEIYLYLTKKAYDYSCSCLSDSKVLAISKDFILDKTSETSALSKKLNENMLTILSEKAFHLNKKLLIQSSYSLRQKIAHFLLQQDIKNNIVYLEFNREELAEYITTTRPSLSRELSNMEKDNLIKVSKSEIRILNINKLENLL